MGSAPRRRAPLARRRWAGLWFVAPAFAVYAAFVLFPLGRAVFYSLHDWSGIGESRFIGFDNYREAFDTPLLRTSIFNALKLIVFFAVIPVSAGLLLTSLLARGVGRGMAGYRLVFFVPYVLPMVATGIIWRWMYNPNGIVNQTLSAVGLGSITRAWLGDFDYALIAVGLVGSWMLSGFCMMLFLAGAQRIDESLYEAAVLDGAGPWWQFRAVTLPGLRREISVALVVTTIAALASFDIVYVTTNGGPGNTTVVPGLLAYRLAFRQQRVGLAAALSVILTVLVFAVAGLMRLISRERR
ncbi:MAG TPA: sugar ABC transporter permease [Ilumatobacter sp.]|nr:sugar ABC transporter permease [Ilumatobacter sp.]